MILCGPYLFVWQFVEKYCHVLLSTISPSLPPSLPLSLPPPSLPPLFPSPSLPPSTILCSEPNKTSEQESALEECTLAQGGGIERQATTSVGSEESIPFPSPSDTYLEKVKLYVIGERFETSLLI